MPARNVPGLPRRRPTATCAYCGERFELPPLRRGPRPSYCSPAHKQRAYEARRAATATAERLETRSELTRLRAKISRLERENLELRRERDEALDEIAQLRPLPPHLARLAGREPIPPPPPAPPPERRRRRR
ncbi:MAG TPA: hypothetical protein VHE83_16635 [Mycobacteriales bacterium]|nr:hypothetical protein [Mycobacteriales bacterium]